MKIWSGSDSVKTLKDFVLSEVRRIESGTFNRRKIRQLADARNFLDMLSEPDYIVCERIIDLKRKIAQERKELQGICQSMNKYFPGYQLNFDDNDNEMSEENVRRIRSQKCLLEEKIHWLHKCLGICHNKEYFR